MAAPERPPLHGADPENHESPACIEVFNASKTSENVITFPQLAGSDLRRGVAHFPIIDVVLWV